MATHGIDPQARGLAARPNLNGIAGLTGTGIVSHTGTGTFTERTITGTADQVAVTNGNGVSGNPVVSLLGNALALSGLTGAADKLAYFTGSAAMTLTNLVSQARSFLADPDSLYVNFLQAGTGGAASTARAKLREQISDADFSTLEQALTAATGKVLLLTQAHTRSTTATVPAGTTLRGHGGSITITGILVNALTVGGDNVTIEGVRLIGSNTATNPATVSVACGIYGSARNNLTITGCLISGFDGSGIMMQNCFNVSIFRNFLYGNNYTLSDCADITFYSSSDGGRASIEGNFCMSNNSQAIYVNAIGHDSDISIVGNVILATTNGYTEPASPARRHGIELTYSNTAGSGRILATGNVVRNTSGTGIYVTAGSYLNRGIVITSNVISKVGIGNAQGSLTGGIVVAAGGMGTIVALNSVYDYRGTGSTGGINISTSISGAMGLIFGNTIDTSAAHGIILQDSSTAWTVRSNILRNITGNDIFESTSSSGGHAIEDNDIVRINDTSASILVAYGSGTRPTYIRRNTIYGLNNTTATGANTAIFLTNNTSRNVIVEGNNISTFYFGVRPDNTITARNLVNVVINNNRIENCHFGITCYDYAGTGVVPLVGNVFAGNTADTSGAGGYNVGYISRVENGRVVLLDQTGTPAYGTWLAGDRAEFVAPAAGGNIGTVCTTGGAVGTWKTYGAIQA